MDPVFFVEAQKGPRFGGCSCFGWKQLDRSMSLARSPNRSEIRALAQVAKPEPWNEAAHGAPTPAASG
jgi:hypothetical protein